jgi:sugar lactone lactonase YvrE
LNGPTDIIVDKDRDSLIICDQLSGPRYIFVDQDRSVYVSEYDNQRVTKWMEGAEEGVVVAGGQDQGNDLTQLSNPAGIIVDRLGTVYVAEWGNHRITRWIKDATHGSILVQGWKKYFSRGVMALFRIVGLMNFIPN